MDLINSAPYVAIGITIASCIIALAYMAGKALGREEYILFAKTETYELIFVGILFVSLGFFTPLLNSFVNEINPEGFAECNTIKSSGVDSVFRYKIPDDMDCYMGVSIMHFDNLFFELKYFTLQMVSVQAYNGIVETTYIDKQLQGKFGTNIHISGIPVLLGPSKAVTLLINNLMNYVTNAGIYILFQKFMLVFMFYGAPHIIGLGMLLRCFPGSRKLGGLMIAIALSIILVMPSMYAFADRIYRDIPSTEISTGISNMHLVKTNLGAATKASWNGKSSETVFLEMEENLKNKEFYSKWDEDIKKEEEETEKALKDSGMTEENFLQRTVGVMPDLLKWLFNNTIGKILSGSVAIWNFIVKTISIVTKIYVPLFYSSHFASEVGDLIGMDEVRIGGIDLKITLIDILIEDLSNIMIFSYFFSFVAMLSVIAFIKELSPLLGGDVEIAGLTNLL